MLIKCVDCNQDISDSADTCPKCGCPEPKGFVVLQFDRTDGFPGGSGVPFDIVRVDGKTGTQLPIGTIGRGEKKSIRVPAGQFNVRFLLMSTVQLDVPVTCANTNTVAIKLQGVLLGLKLLGTSVS